MRRTILIILLLVPLFTRAQEKLTPAEVDKETYAYYLNGEWKKLIHLSKEAKMEGIDFFYLNTRTAIAYYNMGHYRKSIPLFEKALEEIKGDTILLEYLYYAYLFSGRNQDAVFLTRKFPESLKKSLDAKPKAVRNFSVESGVSSNTDYNSISTMSRNRNSSVYDGNYYPKNQYYVTTGLVHDLGPGVRYTQAYTYIQINEEQHIREMGNQSNESTHTTAQNQYYGALDFNLGNGFHLIPSLNMLWGKYSYTALSYDSNDAAVYSLVDENFNDYSIYLGLFKNFTYFSTELSGSYANLLGIDCSQFNGQLAIYPLANLNFYLVSTISLKQQKLISADYSDNNMVFNQKIGFKAGPFWLEGYYTDGPMQFLSEANNYVIWNTPYTIDSRWGANLSLPIHQNRLQLVFRYYSMKQKGYLLYYEDTDTYQYEEYNFTNQNFSGGLTWNF
jgi:hypothetical protein